MTELLSATPDLTLPIAIGVAEVAVATAGVAEQYVALAFSGTSGQQISLNITSPNPSTNFGGCPGPDAPVYVSIINPDRSKLVNNGGVWNSSGILSYLTLPQTGPFLIFIDPAAAAPVARH